MVDTNKRGEIINPERAKQLRDFSGLRFGNITPTDIDGLIEYKNWGYVVIELKYKSEHLPDGQKLALERLCDDLYSSGKETIGIFAKHSEYNCDIPIDVANCGVFLYRYKKQWIEPRKPYTVAEMIKSFLVRFDYA